MFKYFIFALFYFFSLHASTFEEFYILPMGQGNSQLLIYHNGSEKVAVLYDLGSKSLQMHPKFMSRGEWKQRFVDLEFKSKSVDATKGRRRARIKVDSLSSPPPKPATKDVPFSTNAKMSTYQRDSLKGDLQSFVSERLTGLNHLFIFLSHSDEDHINFINSNTIPENVPITIFLAGDWFGNVGCKGVETNLTSSVRNVLAFLKERIKERPDDVRFNFPYYNDFKITEDDGSSIDFNAFVRQSLIDREIDNTLLEGLSNHCLRTKIDAPIPEFFSGNFTDLYNSVFSEASAHASTSASHGLKAEAAVDAPEDFEEYVKRHIHIWSVNHQTDDINGHSMVVSCTLPTLNMSIVLTGDALHSVFQRITSHYKGQDFRQILGSKFSTSEFPTLIHSQHIVTFMLPHHASEENSSGTALRFFKPDVFGIPAGDGGQYGHPSFSLIQNIDNLYAEKRDADNFYNKYEIKKSLDFVAIRQKKHVQLQIRDFNFPYLCPNLYGCIKWDKSGIYTNFDDVVDVNETKFKVLYSSHLWEAPVSALDELNINDEVVVNDTVHAVQNVKMKVVALSSEIQDSNYSCILKRKNKNEFFAGVPVDDKLYFYKLIRAES